MPSFIEWWILPIAVTVGSFAAVYFFGPKIDREEGAGDDGSIEVVISYSAAAIVSSLAWLAWALLAGD